MSARLVIGALVIGFALALLSLPWLLWATRCTLLGDDEGFRSAADAAPVYRYLERIAAHS